MVILGIETSCDETAAALVKRDRNSAAAELLASTVASSVEFQKEYGGVVPEIAARRQLQSILPVIHHSLAAKKEAISGTKVVNRFSKQSKVVKSIDAIAVTVGPGLIGSLLVGVETAKALALAWDKPLIPVNHLLAHFYACWLTENEPPAFPALGLLVSGGHTDLILLRDHHDYDWLGGTRDDAAGEAFDKIARILGLGYPGGPEIARAAENGDPKAFDFPRPMIKQDNLDFSFSGLKTAVLYTVRQLNKPLPPPLVADLAAAAQEAITDVLIAKTKKALAQRKIKSLIVAGGVAANKRLRSKFTLLQKRQPALPEKSVNYAGNNRAWQLFLPPPQLCTDNAAGVAARAAFDYRPKPLNQVQAEPNLQLS
jgi:N6-L-threonylcarbamoyladenine synthase